MSAYKRPDRQCDCPRGDERFHYRRPQDDATFRDPARASEGALLRAATAADRTLAQQIGGFGLCGRPVCCARWLAGAADHKVSIKMAKAQKISLSPENLNGYCCRLKCCLAFETAPAPDGAQSNEQEKP